MTARITLPGIGLACMLSLLFWPAWPAAAGDLYVNNAAGNDAYDGSQPLSGGNQSGPFATIDRALKAAHAGDRISIARTDQPYAESLTLQAGRHSGTAMAPFVIEGNGAVLEGAQPVPPDAWDAERGYYRFRPAKKAYHNLFRDGAPLQRRYDLTNDGPPPDLQPLQWCLSRGDIYFRPEDGRSPVGYNMSHTVLPVGITLYDVRHVVIRNLVLQGFQLDGLNAHDNAFDIVLQRLTCRRNGRSGISIGGACRVRIESSLLRDNAVAQLRSEGQCHVVVRGCALVGGEHNPELNDSEGGQVSITESQPAPPEDR